MLPGQWLRGSEISTQPTSDGQYQLQCHRLCGCADAGGAVRFQDGSRREGSRLGRRPPSADCLALRSPVRRGDAEVSVLQKVISFRGSADRVVVTTPARQSPTRLGASHVCRRSRPILVCRWLLSPTTGRLSCEWHTEHAASLDEPQLCRPAAWSRGIVVLPRPIDHRCQRRAMH